MPAAPSGGAVSPAQTPRANTLAVGNNRTMPLAPCQRIAARGRMPDYCASSKARTLKQLRPGMTEQSRAECEYRQRAPFALLIPFSSSTLFHPQENWDAPCKGSARQRWAVGLRSARLRNTIQSIAITLCPLYLQNAQIAVYAQSIQITVRMTPPQCRHSRLARVHPRMGARLRPRPDFRTACRRCEGRACQVCHVSSYEQLRAFTSSYERLRACSSAPGRV